MPHFGQGHSGAGVSLSWHVDTKHMIVQNCYIMNIWLGCLDLIRNGFRLYVVTILPTKDKSQQIHQDQQLSHFDGLSSRHTLV